MTHCLRARWLRPNDWLWTRLPDPATRTRLMIWLAS